ncbi:hypothetical protein BJ742DRAFT_29137 [Cladochytrium replicatum]|nr:hypothetical protein BJ742DRAFT_29137 [Cladochytrium replicatum]
MAPTPKDYPSFRSTFAQNKQDGSLDQLPLLIWGYRIGAGAFVIYSAYDFFATIYLCSVPVSGFGSSSRMTTCDYLAQVGLIYIVIIELILSVILLIGHLASIVLSVFVLRWSL